MFDGVFYIFYLDWSPLNHKHLGSSLSPSKVDLNSDLILLGSSTYNGVIRSSNSIFVITYSDGTLFSGNFDNYGVPEVYIDNLKLSNSDYRFELEDNLIKEFGSIVEAEKELKIKTIKAVLYKKQNTAGGFIFKYLD